LYETGIGCFHPHRFEFNLCLGLDWIGLGNNQLMALIIQQSVFGYGQSWVDAILFSLCYCFGTSIGFESSNERDLFPSPPKENLCFLNYAIICVGGEYVSNRKE
jgi:hypothetical protein